MGFTKVNILRQPQAGEDLSQGSLGFHLNLRQETQIQHQERCPPLILAYSGGLNCPAEKKTYLV